jgi:hypothetical protein
VALSQYKVVVNGSETILNLTEDEAKAYPDAEKVGDVEEVQAASESREVNEDGSVSVTDSTTKRAAAPKNKSAES